MQTRVLNILFLIFFFILLSCSSEGDAPVVQDPQLPGPSHVYQTIDEELKPFVNSFIDEMKNRGRNFSNKSLEVVFVDRIGAPNGEDFCGYGWSDYGGRGVARVEILENDSCWNNWNDIEKENLIYHELGHALLDRPHLSKWMPNGSSVSIMCDSNYCNNFRTYNKYQTEQRSYYLDELANPNTEIPEWGLEKIYQKHLYSDDFNGNNDDWEFVSSDEDNNPYTAYIEENSIFDGTSALAISSIESFDGVRSNWRKDFNISDFKTNANIKVRADVLTKGLSQGNIAIYVQLFDANDEVFALYSKLSNRNSTDDDRFENFEVTVTCLPEETKKIRVYLYLKTSVKASVHFDNLEIELYE